MMMSNSGAMKQSIISQSGTTEVIDPMMQDGYKQMQPNMMGVDPEEAENRMLTRIERLEKWEKQRQASKFD